MAVFRWGHAFDAFRDFEREVDRLMRSLTLEGFRIGRPFPAVNIYELEGEILLTAELPGVSVDDLELSVANGLLTIAVSRGETAPVPEERYRRSERPVGRWERTFSLPEKVLDEEMYAELNHGVLKLHLPKAPAEAPRKIPVSEVER
ncbi:MAG: Hsp20/alpha crystallin family protein [Planctomycetaceae bacterium]|nr:Hsp20/alpha crystallin family protein [Planctomycetaceae bacterium]